MASVEPIHVEGPRLLWSRLDMLRRRRLLTGLVTVGVFAVGTAFAYGLPSLYRASATLLVDGLTRNAGAESVPIGVVDIRLQAIKEEALSRARLTDLIDRFDLYPRLRKGGGMEVALAQLQRDIRVENTSTQQVNGQNATVAFRLSYVGRDPKTTADVTNALAAFYVAQSDRMRSQQATSATEFLKAQLNSTKQRMDAQEGRVSAYTSSHMGGLPQQMDANLAALERLTNQLRVNSDEQMRLMERRQTLQNQIAELDVKPPEDPNSTAARLEQLRKQLSDLQVTATEANPDVKELKRQIATLTQQAQHEAAQNTAATSPTQRSTLQTALHETDDEIAKLEHDNQSLRGSINDYQKRVEDAPAREPQFQAVMRDYQTSRDQYDALEKRYNDAQIAEREQSSTSGEEFRVLDAAAVPTLAAGPNRVRLLVLAALLAILAGLGAAALAERLDTSFHSMDDLRTFTRVPVLASIPQIHTAHDGWSSAGRASIIATASTLLFLAIAAGAFLAAQRGEEIARILLRIS